MCGWRELRRSIIGCRPVHLHGNVRLRSHETLACDCRRIMPLSSGNQFDVFRRTDFAERTRRILTSDSLAGQPANNSRRQTKDHIRRPTCEHGSFSCVCRPDNPSSAIDAIVQQLVSLIRRPNHAVNHHHRVPYIGTTLMTYSPRINTHVNRRQACRGF